MESFPFANKGVLDGTSYDEVCAKIKDVLLIITERKVPSLSNQQKSFQFIIHSFGAVELNNEILD